MDAGEFCCICDLLISCLWVTVPDVVSNGVVKQDCVLGNNTNSISETGLGDMSNVLTVDKNTAFLGVIKPVQQS